MKKDAKDFYRSLLVLVLPIVVQNLINAAVSSADVIMLGYVGQDSLAAASLAGQVQFILNLFFMGVGSGITMLAAQYWGKGDTDSIENILGVALRISLVIATLFAAVACIVPTWIMRIFTSEQELIRLGAIYLRIVGVSYILMSVSQGYYAVMRSIERVKICTMIVGCSLMTNILLNAVLIFGLFGAPKLGIAGVAIATLTARVLEIVLCIMDSLRVKELRINPSILLRRNEVLKQDFMKYSLPALGNEVVWGVAFSMYSVIMGHLGSDVVAANSVVTVARNFGTILCFALANGGGILLGKTIGLNKLDQAKADASRLCRATFISGIAGGILVLLCKPLVFSMATLSDTALGYLNIMVYINSFYIIGQAMNTCVICGVFRAGGDSRFGFICDILDMWAFSVPLGFFCAFVLKLPVMSVYIILCMDEFVKMPFIYRHYKSYKWLKNITRDFS